MAAEIKVPEMGESVIEATVGRWLKQVGEPVKAGEPLVELETDKINLEVGAQSAGVLARIDRPEGDTVNVGDVLGMVDSAESVPTPDEQGGRSPDEALPDESAEGQTPQEAKQINKEPQSEGPREGQSTFNASPVARRAADELGIDLSQVTPSSGGRITRQDVEDFAHRQGEARPKPETLGAMSVPAAPPVVAKPTSPPAAAAPSERPEERIRMSRRRQTIARRLVEAQQNAAMLTTFNEIDMSAVMDLRKRRREGFKERFGVDLGFMPFFIRAVVSALKAFPYLNAEIQGDEIVLKKYYDIGIAVGSDEGLVVPVVRDADRMNFAELEKSIRTFVDKVNSSSLTLDDLRGGTFTITNGGVYGSLMSTPILNPPQVAILGMHRILPRPMVINGQIEARPMMYVALSYDHRIVDGSEAVRFLVRVKELVEDPEALLFG